MFKEIQTELMSIISTEPIEKIAHMPSKDIAKTMEIIYNINFESIEKVYTEEIDNNTARLVVVYRSKGVKSIAEDLCTINGKVYHITLIPYDIINADADALTLCKTIIKYAAIRVSLIIDKYSSLTAQIKDNTLDLITLQSIPIITCAVMREIYNGPTLSNAIYLALTEIVSTYKTVSSEQGINTILNLFDEGLGVDELLDSGFICSIPVDDQKYPGIWGTIKEKPEQTDDSDKE